VASRLRDPLIRQNDRLRDVDDHDFSVAGVPEHRRIEQDSARRQFLVGTQDATRFD
jgi:hypothetical protein